MSNYLITTQKKPLFEEEMVEDIKENFENFYLNSRDNDHIGFCVPMKWQEFTKIIKQMRLETAITNMLPDKIHQIRTLSNGIISIICQNDLTEDYMANPSMWLKGLQFTQVCIIGLEQLNGWLVSNICARVRVRI